MARDCGKHCLSCQFAHFDEREGDRGKRDRQVSSKGAVVEPDDCDIVGNLESQLAQTEDCSGREVIACADKGVGWVRMRHKLLCQSEARVLVPVARRCHAPE